MDALLLLIDKLMSLTVPSVLALQTLFGAPFQPIEQPNRYVQIYRAELQSGPFETAELKLPGENAKFSSRSLAFERPREPVALDGELQAALLQRLGPIVDMAIIPERPPHGIEYLVFRSSPEKKLNLGFDPKSKGLISLVITFEHSVPADR